MRTEGHPPQISSRPDRLDDGFADVRLLAVGITESRDLGANPRSENLFGLALSRDEGFVAALRRKLGVPGLIETAYGRGFRLGEV